MMTALRFLSVFAVIIVIFLAVTRVSTTSDTSSAGASKLLFVTVVENPSFCRLLRHHLRIFVRSNPTLPATCQLLCYEEFSRFSARTFWTYVPLLVYVAQNESLSSEFDWLVVLNPLDRATTGPSFVERTLFLVQNRDPASILYVGGAVPDGNHPYLQPGSSAVFSRGLVLAAAQKLINNPPTSWKADHPEYHFHIPQSSQLSVESEFELGKFFKVFHAYHGIVITRRPRFPTHFDEFDRPFCLRYDEAIRTARMNPSPSLSEDSSSFSSPQQPFCLPDGSCSTKTNEEDSFVPWASSTGYYDPTLTAYNVVFAVKTAQQYHQSRVAIVRQTWAPDAKRLHFFSDVEDNELQTIWKNIPNTQDGHCGKLRGILKHLHRSYVHGRKNTSRVSVKFFAIVDDDTLLSVPRLLDALKQYDPQKPLLIGERFAWGFHPANASFGWNYITGGAGMILTRAALVQLIANYDRLLCDLGSPDDWYLGIWMERVLTEASILHQPGFHQFPPSAYMHNVLEFMPKHISFHSCQREEDTTPLEIYAKYLKD